MNILLHICCAPCALYPVEELRRGGNAIAGFFYNPNIHPYSEYARRMECAVKFASGAGFNLICPDYELEKYLQHVVYNEAASERCPVCWWIRLERTARYAKDNGFDAFTTTLLGSPYQDQVVIQGIADEVARNAGVAFYAADFTAGFKAAQRRAREEGMYMQKYCGCLFSEKEMLDKKAGRLR